MESRGIYCSNGKCHFLYDGLMRSKWVVLGLIILVSVVNHINSRYLASLMRHFTLTDLTNDQRRTALWLLAPSASLLISLLPGGVLADRFGSRRVLTMALVMSAILVSVSGLAATQREILLERSAFYMCEGLAIVSTYRLIGESFSIGQRSGPILVYFSSASLFSNLDPKSVPQMSHSIGPLRMDVCLLVATLIAAGIVYQSLSDRPSRDVPSEENGAARTDRAIDLLDVLRYPHVWLLAGAYLMVALAAWASETSSQSHMVLQDHAHMSQISGSKHSSRGVTSLGLSY